MISEIRYNPANAELFTQHLSDVYRYILQCQNQRLTTLREELDFLNSYIFLHRVRLGDCISYDCRIPPEYMERQIPPLTLQLLVENVIKHNSISPDKPMTIHIEIDNEYLVVSNPVSPKKKKDSSSGIGLKNLSNRCRLMSNKNIVIQKEDSIFTVKIPIIQ